MIYTPLIQKAIQFATRVHAGQYRKGKDTPYITHPLTVALILARVTKDEDVIVAGILHDTIEDCEPYGSVTKELTATQFNEDIANLVDAVTEKDKTLPWYERKMAALNHIKNMDKKALLLKSADVLHNLTDLNQDIEKDEEQVFDKFNASKNEVIGRFEKLIPEIARYYLDNPLKDDLEKELHKLRNITREFK